MRWNPFKPELPPQDLTGTVEITHPDGTTEVVGAAHVDHPNAAFGQDFMPRDTQLRSEDELHFPDRPDINGRRLNSHTANR